MHTQMSAMDGMIDVKKLIKTAQEFGHKAVAVTDNGVVQAFPGAYRSAREMAENFTAGLKFHTVTVLPGYYEGFQFWVEEKHSDYFDLDRESEYCIDNEYARYYFDTCRSKALRAAEAEKRRIIRWLVALDGKGFDILVCKGVFSNGIAVYAKLNG